MVLVVRRIRTGVAALLLLVSAITNSLAQWYHFRLLVPTRIVPGIPDEPPEMVL